MRRAHILFFILTFVFFYALLQHSLAKITFMIGLLLLITHLERPVASDICAFIIHINIQGVSLSLDKC